MANIPLQYPFPYKTTNNTGFTSSVEFNTVTVLGDVTIDQNLTVAGNITTTDLTVGDDLIVGGTIDAQALRAFGIWDVPTATVTGAGAWMGFDVSGHTVFGTRKSTAGQTNSFRWYAYTETNAFQAELMRLSNAGNLFISGTRIEFPLVHLHQPPGTFPQYDFYFPSSMGSAGQVLTSAGVGNPTYWTTPPGGGGGGGTVTNVTGASPVTVTSPSTTPNISLTTIPTTLGGTGLTTVGTSGQVLSSNGTTLQYVTLPTPVTSVAATSPLASSGGATPTISIASSTGTGAVALQTAPSFINSVTITHPTQAQLTLLAGTVPSLANISDINLNTIGGGGGTISQYIRAAYSPSNGYYISVNPGNDFLSNAARSLFPNIVSIGGDVGTSKLNIGDGAMDSGLYGTVQISQTDVTNTKSAISFVRVGNYVHGLGYLSGTNTFGFGQATISGFTPNFLSIVPASGNVGIGTTTPSEKLQVQGRIRCVNTTGDVGALSLKTGSDENYLFTNGASGLYADVNNGAFVVRSTTAGPYNRVAAFLAASNTLRTYIDFGKAITANNGCFLAYDTGTTGQFVIAHHGITGELVYSANQTLTCPGTVLARRSTDCQVSINPESSGSAGVEVRAIGSVAYLDLTAATPSPGADYDFRIRRTNGSTHTNFEMTVAGGGGYVFDRTVRATNYTTNGVDTFTYDEGSFTPRLGAFRRVTAIAYELSASLPSASITASYSTQSGYYSRVGKTLTYNLELRWTISTSGIAPDDYDICILLPTGFNPNSMVVAGACLNFPNTIGGVSNPMGTLVQYPPFSTGGNVPALFPTTGTGGIAYPIFAPGGTQILQMCMSYAVN